MLVSHVGDLVERSEYTPQLSAYLTPAEQREIWDAFPYIRDRLVFWGGAEGADRRRAVILPAWVRDSVAEELLNRGGNAFSPEMEKYAGAAVETASLEGEFPALLISASEFVTLSHRDYLGAIMNLGLERNAFGDIFTVSDHGSVVLCTPLSASLIGEELRRVGRDGVRVSPAALPLHLERSFEELTLTVSSMRLDCVIKELCSLSRESAKEAISGGYCELNYKTADSPDTAVAAGDVISLRGKGKFRILSEDGRTKKDRVRLSAVKYR